MGIPPELLTPAVRPLQPSQAAWMREASRRGRERAARVAACRLTTVTQRFLVDNMVYDRLVASPERSERVGLLCLAGHLGLLMTDIQHEQITDNPDIETMIQVLSLPAICVPAFGVVRGVSRPNMARFGDPDVLAKLRKPRDDTPLLWPERPRTPAGNESRREQLRDRDTGDALLAATAKYECAVLVTEDKGLTRSATGIGVPVWGAVRFLDHLDTLSL